MRVTIEDLEALKEMNDELEEGHVEAEKQLQAEIGNINTLDITRLMLTDPRDTLSRRSKHAHAKRNTQY